MLKIKNFIDGQWLEPVSGESMDNYSPVTGKVYSHVADSSKEDVELAVGAARRAFKTWSKTSVEERVHWILKLADLIEKNSEKLAAAESFDQGKPVWLARSVDIPRGSSNLRFFCPCGYESSICFFYRQGECGGVDPSPAYWSLCPYFPLESASVSFDLEDCSLYCHGQHGHLQAF